MITQNPLGVASNAAERDLAVGHPGYSSVDSAGVVWPLAVGQTGTGDAALRNCGKFNPWTESKAGWMAASVK